MTTIADPVNITCKASDENPPGSARQTGRNSRYAAEDTTTTVTTDEAILSISVFDMRSSFFWNRTFCGTSKHTATCASDGFHYRNSNLADCAGRVNVLYGRCRDDHVPEQQA